MRRRRLKLSVLYLVVMYMRMDGQVSIPRGECRGRRTLDSGRVLGERSQGRGSFVFDCVGGRVEEFEYASNPLGLYASAHNFPFAILVILKTRISLLTPWGTRPLPKPVPPSRCM